VIEQADPDIVGLQETRREGDPCTAKSCPPAGPSVAMRIAEELGYHYYDQPYDEVEPFANQALWANAILSRYPIEGPTAHDLDVEIGVDGRTVYATSTSTILPTSPTNSWTSRTEGRRSSTPSGRR
jgi:endonuclease/exonuclease/phosphatase family metal-dependent hydrolase